MNFDDAKIVTTVMDKNRIHALYVVFVQDVTAARTLQVGNDSDCHAYVDVDEAGFPIALELRGWKMAAGRPAGAETDRDRIIESLYGLAIELRNDHRDGEDSRNRISKIAEEARELIAV